MENLRTAKSTVARRSAANILLRAQRAGHHAAMTIGIRQPRQKKLASAVPWQRLRKAVGIDCKPTRTAFRRVHWQDRIGGNRNVAGTCVADADPFYAV